MAESLPLEGDKEGEGGRPMRLQHTFLGVNDHLQGGCNCVVITRRGHSWGVRQAALGSLVQGIHGRNLTSGQIPPALQHRQALTVSQSKQSTLQVLASLPPHTSCQASGLAQRANNIVGSPHDNHHTCGHTVHMPSELITNRDGQEMQMQQAHVTGGEST